MPEKRKIEVFIAGCPLCDEALKTVRRVACDSCDVTVHNLSEGADLARRYGITRVPTVVIDGQICGCCEGQGVNESDLRAAGVGSPR